MNHPPQYGMAPGAPVIPPPPARVGPRRKGSDVRLLLWPAAFVVGAGLGVAAYAWIGVLGTLFDYWIALVG